MPSFLVWLMLILCASGIVAAIMEANYTVAGWCVTTAIWVVIARTNADSRDKYRSLWLESMGGEVTRV